MKSLTIDTHEHDPACDQELYDLLSKEAEPAAPPKAPAPVEAVTMSKEGQDPGESPGDDGEGLQAEVAEHLPVEGRAKGNIDAPWGEEPTAGKKNDPVQFSNEATKQFRKSREDLLAKLFSHEASSGGKEKAASASTLLERVRRTSGRH